MRFLFAFLALQCAALAALSPQQKQKNLESFDFVWDTVKSKHWDPKLGGVDWDKVRAELRPRAEAAASDEEARAIIADMLSRLHQSHFAVIPGDVYHDVDPGGAGSEGDANPGFEIRIIDKLAVVTAIAPDSPAARAGVKPGWILEQIDGEMLTPVLRRVSDSYATSTMRAMMLERAVFARLEGRVGDKVSIRFRNGQDRFVNLELDRQAPRGTPAHFGFLPESHLWVETRRIGDIAYIGFNLWLEPDRVMPEVQKLLNNCEGCQGAVIDLRGNPGGIGLMAAGLAGYFISEPGEKLGTMTMRNLPLKFVIFPRPPIFKAPLAILIDGLSASTSEIFAGGMQDLKRARLFGDPTAGAALPSMIERLPNGDGFQFAAATYQSASGKTLEGRGVIPDELAPLTRAGLLAGHDPQLEAALHWLHAKGSKP